MTRPPSKAAREVRLALPSVSKSDKAIGGVKIRSQSNLAKASKEIEQAAGNAAAQAAKIREPKAGGSSSKARQPDLIERVIRNGLTADSCAEPTYTKTRSNRHWRHSMAPIDYLRHYAGNEDRITDEQHSAALRFMALHEQCESLPSNTGAVLGRLEKTVIPTPKEAANYRENGTVFGRDDSGPEKDYVGQAPIVFQLIRRIEARIDRIDRELLRELLVERRHVGAIATKWNLPHVGVEVLIKCALWRLVAIMESVDREFQAEQMVRRSFEP